MNAYDYAMNNLPVITADSNEGKAILDIMEGLNIPKTENNYTLAMLCMAYGKDINNK